MLGTKWVICYTKYGDIPVIHKIKTLPFKIHCQVLTKSLLESL